MFNGYNETPLISYNEFDQEREKKGENVSKWSFMHEPGAQPTTGNCQTEFWSGKPSFLGIPHISKCNCSSCYPSTEIQSYQSESPRHRPWLPRSFPVPFNSANELCKLPGCHQWDNVGVPNQSFPDSNVQYLHQAEGTHSFYRHYANSMLTELNQRGLITSVNNSDLAKQKQKVEGQNGTRQPVFCDPGCNYPKNLEKRIDNRNSRDSNKKYSNVDPYRHSYSIDQHMSRLPVVEPHIKAVPSNLNENRVPSTGHRNVKKNTPHSTINQEYNDPEKVVFRDANLEKTQRAAYQSAMGREGSVPENFLYPFQKAVDYKDTGIIDHPSYNLHEQETQKLILENIRHADFSRNTSDAIKRNSQPPATDGRKDCAIGQNPVSKYIDLENEKNSCGGFYTKEFSGNKLTRTEPETSSCFQSSGDLIKSENSFPRSTLIFNDRYPEKMQGAFSYQNNPSDYRNYLRSDYPYQGYSAQGLYDYSTVPQFQEMNQYGLRQQQHQQLPIRVVDQFMQNKNVIFNSSYQQPGNPDKIPQQIYPEKSQFNSFNTETPLEEVKKNDYLETIKTKEMNKNANSKISPLRLLRKKKFVGRSGPEPIPVVSTPSSAPALDVRKFWSTWAEEEEENVAPTQMVVLDCQNIDAEQAKLLHLCETDSFRAVNLQEDSIVALKDSERTAQLIQGVKNSEQITVVQDSVVGKHEEVIEQEETPVIRKPDQSIHREITTESNNDNQQSVVRDEITETAPQKIASDVLVKTDHKPCKKGRSSASQEDKDRHKKLDVEREKANGLDKWTEKKFDFLKRAEESRAAEKLKHEEEKKKIFEKRLSFQQGTHSELKKTIVQRPVEEKEPPEPKIEEKVSEWLSSLDENSQSTSPAVSDADLPNLPTSEYRRNKFLDYSDRKAILSQFQNETAYVEESDCHEKVSGGSTHKSSSEMEDIKKEQAIKLEPTNATQSSGSDKLGKNEGDLCLPISLKLNDGTGFEVEDIMKKISEINVGSPQINTDEVKALSKLDAVKKYKKPKKSKKLERKEEMKERSDNLAVENISVSKPTIKFSIQKSHDLKISLKVLNSSTNSNSSSSNKYEISELDEEMERKEVERTNNPEDSASNSTEIITLRLQSYQRDALHDDRNHRQTKKRNGDSKENKRRFRRNKIPVEKNPVLKIKKSRYMLQEKEEEPLGREPDTDHALNTFGADSDDFQVQETVESAKIKLTFKRHKTSCETEYTISKKCVGKLLGEDLDPGEAEYFAHWETTKKKSGRRKDDEKSVESSVESPKTNQEPTETENAACDDSGSNSILKEGSPESTPKEDSKNVELNTEEKNCISNLAEKLPFPISPETQSDVHFTLLLPQKKVEELCDDEDNFGGTNSDDKEKETKEYEDSKMLEDEEGLKTVDKDEDPKMLERDEDSKGLKDNEDLNMEEGEDLKMLEKNEDFSFGAVELERPLEEGDPEEISLDLNWDISTKKTVGSAEVNKNEEDKLIMFSTNETHHSENESSCKSNSDKGVDEAWVSAAHTVSEDGNKYSISKSSLASDFLISNENDPEDCNQNELEIEKNYTTNVESDSSEECAKENSSNNVLLEDLLGKLDQSVNKCSEQQEIENQNSGVLSENLNSINTVKSYGESEEVNSEEEHSEALSPSEPTGEGASPPESLLVTPVLLSPLSQTLDNTESAELSKQSLEKNQDVLPETGVDSFEVFESNVLLNQIDSKSETELEEGEIVDDSSEEQNETQVENLCQDVREDVCTEIANKEENKSSIFKFENFRKITRRNTLSLEVLEGIERTKESQKRVGYKAKSCPSLLEFGEVETPLFDIPVEDIPLPPGDPPPENCFDFVDYFKKTLIYTKEKSNESNNALSLPQTQIGGNMSPSIHQSPIVHSNLQISPSQPKPEDSQEFSSLKNSKLKLSSSEPKFDKSEIEKESFECEKNKKSEKLIEEKNGDLIQFLMSLDTLGLEEEMHQKNVSEQEAKQVHKPDLKEEKKEEVAETETNSTSLGLKSVVEETNSMERPSTLKGNDAGATTENVSEVSVENSENIQEKNYAKTDSEVFEPQLANINFSGTPVELTAEDVDFEEVDLKTVEMMDEPITRNFQNSNKESSNCIREEFYECEDIPTSEDLPNGDGDAEMEKVSDDDKFRNIMQNCLDNAKKFLNVDKLKLFSCSVDDLLELDCEGPDSNPSEKESDKSTNHFSRDVLLASCEETVTDDLGLSGNFQPTDMSMDFEPSFGMDAPHNLCSEILPVNNWPYLEEEVPASPTKSKSEDTNLIPIEGSETNHSESDGLAHESKEQQEIPLRSQKNRECFDIINHNKTKRTFSSGNESANSKRVKRSLTYEMKTSPRSPTIPRRNTIESFARDLLACEKKEITKPKNCIDKIENICKKNGSLKCSLSLEKMSHKNRHGAVKPVENNLLHGNNFGKLEEVVKKTASWQPKVMLSRIVESENQIKNKNCAMEREKVSSVKTSEAFLVSTPRNSFAKHAAKKQKLDLCDSKNVLEKLKYYGRKSNDLDHNANKNRKEIVQAPFGLLRRETTPKLELTSEREIDSIYSTLRMDSKGSSSVTEVSKRKKSRFRNLHAKVRSGHDLKIIKDSFAQSGVPNLTAAVDEESILNELFKDCDSSKESIVNDFRAKSTKHADEKTKRKSSEKMSPGKNRKSSTSDASPDRIRDKITGLSLSSCDETKTQKSKEESEHWTSDENKCRSGRKHRKEKSEFKFSHKHGSHSRHRSESSSERRERTSVRKRHSKEPLRKNPEAGKENPDYGDQGLEDPWVCQVCGFNDANERIAHVKSHPFHCQSCHLAFGEETYFVSHLTKKHKDIRNQHHCLLCELSFDTEKQYQAHLETREHTHLESVEKNTINTLFTLLTGQPCSVLGHVEMKPEWLPNQPGTVHFYHQATPLSLALQYLKVHHDLTSYSTVSSAHPN